MLNIRINFTIDVKKWLAGAAALFITFAHITGAPAQAAEVKMPEFYHAIVFEKAVTVRLQYLDVTTTRQAAKAAVSSPYAKYFDIETLAFLTTYAKGMPLQQWQCLDTLWTHESHFNPKALNMGSKAFGIAQFLPTTWGDYNVTKTASAALQIQYGLHYIQSRYGDACGAWSFWQVHKWY